MSRRKSDPGASPTAALAADLHTLAGKLKRRLREQASAGDLTPSQTAVLMRLDREGPATVTSLARLEGVRSQSMGATVASLEALGLVRGSPDPADGRQTILSLTPACRDKIRSGRAARHEWLLRNLEAKLAPDEQRQLAAALRLLSRIVDAD
ncbi:MAG TPA: MarR family transcriptional regulator [Bradyrhizobium sp.]|nr:MarR family transcriptional regulator [Bradyrhizobium sp.]